MYAIRSYYERRVDIIDNTIIVITSYSIHYTKLYEIIDHVVRGIELAKEYNLPDRVIEFIPAHHGTTLVSYFYEKEKSRGEGETAKKDFQYRGPKPYSKETGIVMLADTIEAATRAIEEPTIDKRNNFV